MAKQDKAKDKPKEGEEKDEKPAAGKSKDGDGAEASEAKPEGAGAEKKSKKKIIILAAGALAVLLAGGGGAYYMGMFNKHEEKASVELGADGRPIEKPIYYTIPEFLVNLNSGKQIMFLKAIVMLEVAHQEDVPQIEANLPRLTDAYNSFLRELRPSDLTGSAGIQRLREELLLRSNKALAPIKINDILFKEIIVQ